MQLHHQNTEESAQSGIQKKLEVGETVPVVNAHTDQDLVDLLHASQRPKRNLRSVIAFSILMCLMAPLGEMLHIGWLFLVLPFIAAPFLLILWISEKNLPPRVLASLQARLENASLSTLLRAYDFKIPELRSTIQAGLIKRLSVATVEELKSLSRLQKEALVQFTLDQLYPSWTAHNQVLEAETKAATLGFLALATLKMPGAEYPNRRWLNENHDNLNKAIDEYLNAIKPP